MIAYDLDSIKNQKKTLRPKIVVLGVGGAGGNAINTINKNDIKNIECIALNTDIQALENVNSKYKIQIGTQISQGMGTGANPEIGRIAAEEDINSIIEIIDTADIVFLIGGLGGGTGSGAMPVIAKILQERQILSIAIVTKPFVFEGSRRMQVAQNALNKIEELADTLIVIPNQKLFDCEEEENISLKDAFEEVNKVIVNCIKAVSETIYGSGHVNVDFADVKTTMTRMGKAMIGMGSASGENRAKKAIESVLSSPLLEHTSLKGAHSILLNISGGEDLTLNEMNIIAGYIYDQAHPDAHIIVGSNIKNEEDDSLTLTLIATGFEDQIKTRNAHKHNSYSTYSNNYSQNTSYNNFQQNYKNNINSAPINNTYNDKNITNQNQTTESQNNIDVPAFFRKINNEQQNIK